MNTQTLLEALAAIPDHRTRKGRRFPLPTILIITLAAMLSGANDLLAVARWGRRLSPKALQALGASSKRRQAPCHATYHYVFLGLSPEHLRAALGVLVNTAGGIGHVAIDGKRLRGSQHEESPACTCCMRFRANSALSSARWRCRRTVGNVSKRWS